MVSRPWLKRLAYTGMSFFVGWHTLAMVTAPGPDGSSTVKSLRLFLDPYLGLFDLDHTWQFFAPSVAMHDQLRYVIADASGQSHVFELSERWKWFYPGILGWYESILDDPDLYGGPFSAVLCRQHASLRPISVTLLKVEEREFKPADQLKGKHPLDPEFTTVSMLKNIQCTRS